MLYSFVCNAPRTQVASDVMQDWRLVPAGAAKGVLGHSRRKAERVSLMELMSFPTLTLSAFLRECPSILFE